MTTQGDWDAEDWERCWHEPPDATPQSDHDGAADEDPDLFGHSDDPDSPDYGIELGPEDKQDIFALEVARARPATAGSAGTIGSFYVDDTGSYIYLYIRGCDRATLDRAIIQPLATDFGLAVAASGPCNRPATNGRRYDFWLRLVHVGLPKIPVQTERVSQVALKLALAPDVDSAWSRQLPPQTRLLALVQQLRDRLREMDAALDRERSISQQAIALRDQELRALQVRLDRLRAVWIHELRSKASAEAELEAVIRTQQLKPAIEAPQRLSQLEAILEDLAVQSKLEHEKLKAESDALESLYKERVEAVEKELKQVSQELESERSNKERMPLVSTVQPEPFVAQSTARRASRGDIRVLMKAMFFHIEFAPHSFDVLLKEVDDPRPAMSVLRAIDENLHQAFTHQTHCTPKRLRTGPPGGMEFRFATGPRAGGSRMGRIYAAPLPSTNGERACYCLVTVKYSEEGQQQDIQLFEQGFSKMKRL